MSIRDYSNLLLFEDIFDIVPNDFPDIPSLAGIIMTPNILVVEDDCGTTLGKLEDVTYELEGHVELATDVVISHARINQLLSQDKYQVSTRATSHCVSIDGVCKKCYEASNPLSASINVGDRATIQPLYVVLTDVINGKQREFSWPITVSTEYYSSVAVYSNGEKLDESDYTLTDTMFSIITPLDELQTFVLHYYDIDKRPFLYRLADSYSGALLGMRPLPSPALPLRPLLIASLITDNKLESVVEYTSGFAAIPSDLREYMTTIRDPLEKALFIIALNCLYSQVTS